MYIKISENNLIESFPYNLNNLKIENPNTSFPKFYTDEILAEYGIYKVTIEEKPIVDETHQKYARKNQPEFLDGQWTLGWDITEKTSIEIEEYFNIKSNEVKAKRKNILDNTDWIVTFHTEKGTAIPQEWLDYRQALRDITLQEGFPASVIWPTEPSI